MVGSESVICLHTFGLYDEISLFGVAISVALACTYVVVIVSSRVCLTLFWSVWFSGSVFYGPIFLFCHGAFHSRSFEAAELGHQFGCIQAARVLVENPPLGLR